MIEKKILLSSHCLCVFSLVLNGNGGQTPFASLPLRPHLGPVSFTSAFSVAVLLRKHCESQHGAQITGGIYWALWASVLLLTLGASTVACALPGLLFPWLLSHCSPGSSFLSLYVTSSRRPALPIPSNVARIPPACPFSVSYSSNFFHSHRPSSEII